MAIKAASVRRAVFLVVLMALAIVSRPAFAQDDTKYTLGWADGVDQSGVIKVGDENAGTISAVIEIETQGVNQVPTDQAISSKTVTVLMHANDGFEPKSMYYQTEGATEPTNVDFTSTTISGDLYYEGTFTMPNVNTVIGGEFKKKTYTVSVDFGSKHAGFVQQYFAGKEKDGVVVDGAVVKLTVAHGEKPSGVAGSLSTLLDDFLSTNRVDNNELLMTENDWRLLLGKYARLQYRDQEDYYTSREGYYDEEITQDMKLYALWAPSVGNFTLTLTPCKCGDVLTYVDLSQHPWDPVPYQDVEGNVHIYKDNDVLYSCWEMSKPDDGNKLTLQGDTSYPARVYIAPNWGYFLPDDFANSMTLVNGEYVGSDMGGATYRKLNVSVPVKHVAPEGTKELTPTCTKGDSRTFTCSGCNNEVTETADALGHDWGEWTQVKAATCEDKGSNKRSCKRDGCGKEETREVAALGHDWGNPTYTWADDYSTCTATRTCKRDKSHVQTEEAKVTSAVTKEATATETGTRTYTATFENEAFKTQTKTATIPKKEAGVTYSIAKGANSTWTKGSNTSVAITIKRSKDDDTTFKHFTGILMDNKEVNANNYEAKSGSVVVTMPATYLETLSVGEHTFAAKFDDGSASTKLTVKAASSQGTTRTTTTSSGQSSTRSSTPTTADGSNTAIAAALAVVSLPLLLVARRLSRTER